MYGPGNIPLIVPGVHPGSLQSFLRLDDYGLRLGQELTLVPDDPGLPSFQTILKEFQNYVMYKKITQI